MADDVMKPREPGDDGTTVDQINTPMCSENVGKEGGGATHSYKKVVGPANNTDGGAGIEGPGMQGRWDTQIDIKGSNAPNKY